MYEPSARYIAKAEINFLILKAELEFPLYLVKDTGIKHINNTEVDLITNQCIFLFYRQTLIEGVLKFTKMSTEE